MESLQALLGLSATADYRAQLKRLRRFCPVAQERRGGGYIRSAQRGIWATTKTALDTTVFRGFAIADEVAPFIVINDQDAKSAWSFTLMHEMVHLLLGHTGVSGDDVENGVERFCNDVAGEFLLPARELERLVLDDCDEIGAIAERISAWANEFKVSRAMVAYKAYRSALITRETYSQLNAIYRKAWQGERERSRAQAREQETRIRYYTVRRHRLGNRIIGLVERMMAADALSTSKAA